MKRLHVSNEYNRIIKKRLEVEQRKLGCPCCSDSTSSVVVVDCGYLVLPRVAGVVAGVVGVVGVVGLLLLLLPVFAIWHGWTDW